MSDFHRYNSQIDETPLGHFVLSNTFTYTIKPLPSDSSLRKVSFNTLSRFHQTHNEIRSDTYIPFPKQHMFMSLIF